MNYFLFIFLFYFFTVFFFFFFFFVIIITVQICKFNITVSTQFFYFNTPYDAQACSAVSALICLSSHILFPKFDVLCLILSKLYNSTNIFEKFKLSRKVAGFFCCCFFVVFCLFSILHPLGCLSGLAFPIVFLF